MRTFQRLSACAAAALTIAGLSMPAAFADSSIPTSPTPHPVDPNQSPGRVWNDMPRPVTADAGTMLGIVRLLPATVPGDSYFKDPNFQKMLPKQSVLEAGLGRALAHVDSQAYFAHESSTADASPWGVSLLGQTPQPPLGLSQTAIPDHPQPTTSSMAPPPNPGDQVVKFGAINGSVQARWDENRGACVSDQLSDARYSLGNGSALNALPGGLGSLLQIPSLAEAHSNVSLAPVDGLAGKAVQSTSELTISEVKLFAGSPQEATISVLGTPKLTATSTGSEATSGVTYTAPVLKVTQGGKELGTLDAAHPALDIPVPGLAQRTVDAGVVKLSLGSLQQSKQGAEVRGTARLFNLDLLSGQAIGIPTSLAQISFGEQTVRALAPRNGVNCSAPPAAGDAAGGDNATPASWNDQPSRSLALTATAPVIPLFWAGTALLLAGSVLVAAFPRRRANR